MIVGLFWLGLKVPRASGTIITFAIAAFWLWGWFTFYHTGIISVKSDRIHKSKRPRKYWIWFSFYTLIGIFLITTCFYTILTS